MATRPVTVVIASPLEAELVERIRAVDRARVRVVHEPGLIPQARYPSDHIGIPPDLDEAGLARWLAILHDADVLFDFDWFDPGAMARNAPRLRWVQATSSGIGERLRSLGLDRSGIVFTNCAGIHARPLAEWIVLALLYLIKDVSRLRTAQQRRHWDPAISATLAGRRVVLVGLGGIGREAARVLSALHAEVVAVRRGVGTPVEGVSREIARTELLTALGEADALVLACPLTPDTRHMIGPAELAALPQGAHVVNVSRGDVVDEEALVEALRSGHLGGAALDVFSEEPLPISSPLWAMENVLLSPHSVSTVAAENELIVDLFVDNSRRFLAGLPLRNRYEAERGY